VQVDAPQTEATVQELIDAIRDWEDGPEGQYYDFLIDAAGKESLGGGVTVGITATLQNAQIYFPPRSTPVANTELCTTGDAAGRVCVSSTSTFQTDGLVRGDVVYNATTGAMAVILTVDSETQITHLPLTGGSRNDWQVNDGVTTYNNPQCSISGGNLVAVDANGDPMSAVLASPLAQVARASASSATLQTQDELGNTVWQYPVEGAWTAEEFMRLFASVLAGKLSGAGSGTETFRDVDDTKDRIVGTVDAAGNRTAVTRDAA